MLADYGVPCAVRLVAHPADENQLPHVIESVTDMAINWTLNESSTLRFKISRLFDRADPRYDESYLLGTHDIAVQVQVGEDGNWDEGPGSRFVILDAKRTGGPDNEIVYECRGVDYDLSGAVSMRNQYRDSKSGAQRFKKHRPGFILAHNFDGAKENGCMPKLNRTFGSTIDSAQKPWWVDVDPDDDDREFPAGATVADVLMAFDGNFDWRTNFNDLEVYNAGTMGRTIESVAFAFGRDFGDMPMRQRAIGTASHVLAVGQRKKGNDSITITSQQAAPASVKGRSTRGKRVKVINSPGTATQKALANVARQEAARQKLQLEERSIELLATAWWYPFRDVRIGDRVYLQQGSGEFAQVRISGFRYDMTLQEGPSWTILFGDTIKNAGQAVTTRLLQSQGTAVSVGGAGTPRGYVYTNPGPPVAPPQPSGTARVNPPDARDPQAPSGVVSMQWQATEATSLGDERRVLLYRVEGQRQDNAPIGGHPWVQWGTSTNPSLEKSDLPAGTSWLVRVYAQNEVGWSEPAEMTINVPTDQVAPLPPEGYSLDMSPGTATLRWPGRMQGDSEPPSDFHRLEFVTENLRPTVAYLASRNGGQVLFSTTAAAGGAMARVRARAWDVSGNVSDWGPWVEAKIQSVLDETQLRQALEDADIAQSVSIVSKVGAPTSAEPGKVEGDLWFETNTAGEVVAAWLWTGTGWVKKQWGSDALTGVSISKLVASDRARFSQAVVDALVAERVIVKGKGNLVDGTLIENGAVTTNHMTAGSIDVDRLNAGTFEGKIIRGAQIVAPSTSGEITLSNQALTVTRVTPEGDMRPTLMIGGHEDTIALTDATGNTTVTLTGDEGIVQARQVAADTVLVDGVNIAERAESGARGVVAARLVGGPFRARHARTTVARWVYTTPEARWFRFTFIGYVKAGKGAQDAKVGEYARVGLVSGKATDFLSKAWADVKLTSDNGSDRFEVTYTAWWNAGATINMAAAVAFVTATSARGPEVKNAHFIVEDLGAEGANYVGEITTGDSASPPLTGQISGDGLVPMSVTAPFKSYPYQNGQRATGRNDFITSTDKWCTRILSDAFAKVPARAQNVRVTVKWQVMNTDQANVAVRAHPSTVATVPATITPPSKTGGTQKVNINPGWVSMNVPWIDGMRGVIFGPSGNKPNGKPSGVMYAIPDGGTVRITWEQ